MKLAKTAEDILAMPGEWFLLGKKTGGEWFYSLRSLKEVDRIYTMAIDGVLFAPQKHTNDGVVVWMARTITALASKRLFHPIPADLPLRMPRNWVAARAMTDHHAGVLN